MLHRPKWKVGRERGSEIKGPIDTKVRLGLADSDILESQCNYHVKGTKIWQSIRDTID